MDNKLIVHSKQLSTPIDIQEHGDQYFLFGSRKSGNKISVNFGRNIDEKIGMKPLRNIGVPSHPITSISKESCNIFDLINIMSNITFR